MAWIWVSTRTGRPRASRSAARAVCMAPCHLGARSTSAMTSKHRSIGASMSIQLDPSRSAMGPRLESEAPQCDSSRVAGHGLAKVLCDPLHLGGPLPRQLFEQRCNGVTILGDVQTG